MLKIFLCLNLLLLVTDGVTSKPDYIYNERAKGWMKLHLMEATWEKAAMKCHYEGAVLASPLDENIVNGLQEILSSTDDITIHLGTFSLFRDKNFVSIEGVPLEQMFLKRIRNNNERDNNYCFAMSSSQRRPPDSTYYMTTSSCSEQLPYVCYKSRKDNENINECGTFDSRYILDRQTGSCYKMHEDVKPWSKAYEICTDEGGYLVIINNEVEAAAIKNMFQNHTESDYPSIVQFISVGLRSWSDRETWLTIHGEDMADVYNVWASDSGFSNRYNQNEMFSCAFLNSDGSLAENSCEYSAMYICEKEPSSVRYQTVGLKQNPHFKPNPID